MSDSLERLTNVVSKAIDINGGIKCDDLQDISQQIEGLRDAVCRPGLPVNVSRLEWTEDSQVGDLTEAVCAVASAMFAIAHAIDRVADNLEPDPD